MRRALSLACTLSLCFLPGCAEDGDLSESPPVETPAGGDSTPTDTGAPDSTTEEDTTIDSEAVDSTAPDTFVADTFAADTFVADTFVPDTFMPDTAPVDTCVANGCGGCNVLTPPKGSACGICGTYGCSGTMATTCNETASVGSDLTFNGTSAQQGAYENSLAFAYPVRNKGQLVSASFRISKYFIALGSFTPGFVHVEAVRGTPAAPGASLGTVTLSEMVTTMNNYNISAPMPPTARTTFTFSSTVVLAVGDPIFFRVTRTSGNFAFYFWGAASGGPADLTTHDRASTTAPWTTVAFDPEIDVKMNGCF